MSRRCETLAAFLPREHDAALICSGHNRLYLTGFASSAGALIVTKQQAIFLTDGRYIEAARQGIAGIQCLQADRLGEEVAQCLYRLGAERVLLEAEHTTLAELARWQGCLGDIAIEADGALDRQLCLQRLVKDEAELRALEAAQAVTDAAFSHILKVLRAGLRERDIAVELDSYMRRQGAQDVSFATIAAAGPNTSKPHAVPGDYAVQKGDFITMDFGALLDGYHADMTRTVAVGQPCAEQIHVYDTVLRAQTTALEALHEGLAASAADAAARDIIAHAGYGECFGHSTGHGVGVEIHEGPNLSSRSSQVLPAGCVVTVEPGIYLPGRFGVRIEDMAVVTAKGHRDLTASPKQLICL